MSVDECGHAGAVVAEGVGDLFEWDAGGAHDAGGGVSEFVGVPVPEPDVGSEGAERTAQVAGVDRCELNVGERPRTLANIDPAQEV